MEALGRGRQEKAQGAADLHRPLLRSDVGGGVESPEYAGIKQEFQRYINEKWKPWAEEDKKKRKVLRIYTDLFSDLTLAGELKARNTPASSRNFSDTSTKNGSPGPRKTRKSARCCGFTPTSSQI